MPKKVDHIRRQKEILEAALFLFSSKGYHATTLVDIARCAQVARPTLYYYFRDKYQILFFASKQFTDDFLVKYQKILKLVDLSPLDRLRFILTHTVISCRNKRRELVSLSEFMLKLEEEGGEISALIRKRTRPLKNIIHKLLREAQEENLIHCENLLSFIDFLLSVVTTSIVHVLLFPSELCASVLENIGFVIKILRCSCQLENGLDISYQSDANYQEIHHNLLSYITKPNAFK